jgi:hypothetical protein
VICSPGFVPACYFYYLGLIVRFVPCLVLPPSRCIGLARTPRSLF